MESRIFITHDPDLKGHQKTRERWKQSVHLYYSDDFFKTQKNALDAGNSIVMTNHYMFVAKAISSEQVKIHVSRAEEGFLGFRLARMPKNYHITDHFTVMDTSEKSVFLYVSDDSVADPVGNLFISDGLGYRFTHSLENIIKGGGAVDFETVESLDGTFIANRYDINHGTKGGVDKPAGQLRAITEDDIAEEEIKENERMWKEENGGKLQPPMDAGSELRSAGITPGGMATDVAGQEAEAAPDMAAAAEAGAKATLVTEGKNPGHDMNPILSGHWNNVLKSLGVEIVDSLKIPKGEVIHSPDWVADETSWKIKGKAKVTSAGPKAMGPGLFNATKSGFWVGTRV